MDMEKRGLAWRFWLMNPIDFVMRYRSSTAQLFRYALVGIVSNLAGYLIYIGVTWFGVEPKIAVSLLYPVAVLVAYFGHVRYTFADSENSSGGVLRYVLAHVVGFIMNLSLLYILHDLMGAPHQLVQLLAIFLVAGVLFLLFKYYVFPVQQVRKQSI